MHDVFTYESAVLAQARGNFKWMHKTKRTGYARFATLFAIAPTATSSLIIDATEGIEPISSLLSETTGTSSSKQLAPQLQKLGYNYELAGSIPTEALYKHAQVRNKYLDQGQSVNTYAKDVTSAAEVINDIILAESLGLTALYYLQSNTSLEGCDSCGS
jgi:ribonucleoside-diphosphate reductase alpha chain